MTTGTHQVTNRAKRLLRLGAPLLAIVLLGACHRRRMVVKPPVVAPPSVSLPPSVSVPPAVSTPPAVLAPPSVYRPSALRGIASWYGYPYQGRPTASGEIYNMYKLTAAHRTLPFGTVVRVHDLQNGRNVVVRINDRGPFIPGRIIDLSYAAAKRIRMVGPGSAPVVLTILGGSAAEETSAATGIYTVQVGAFHDPANADRLKATIETHFGPVTIQPYDSPVQGLMYRVRVGQLNNETAAEELAGKIARARLATETYVVRLN